MMGCRCYKYSKWREHIADKESNAPEYVEGVSLIMTLDGSNGLTITYNGTDLGENINLRNLEGYKITVRLNNHMSNTIVATVKYDDSTLLNSATITSGGYREFNWTVPTVIVGELNVSIQPMGSWSATDYHRYGLSLIDYGAVPYDFDEVADYFDRFYDCWYIVNPCCDFAKELQVCYDGAKERIDAYYNMMVEEAIRGYEGTKVVQHSYGIQKHTITDDIPIHKTTLTDDMAKQHTDMDVEYAARHTEDANYDYPLTGTIGTSTPSSGTEHDENTKTDKTDVDHDAYKDTHTTETDAYKDIRTDETIAYTDTDTTTDDLDITKRYEFIRAMDSFKDFFCLQFKDCFTIISGVTW